MKFNFFLIVLLLFLNSCSDKKKEISKITEPDQNMELIATYKEAYQALEKNDNYYAAKKFLEAELLYPQSIWAAKSALMASYSYYLQNYYSESLSNLERFIKTYPTDKNIQYAHYLIAMCYYESIEDEKRDSEPLIEAKNKFNFIIQEYPNTDFALDSKFKLELIKDILASKEMYLGRHYMKKQKWIPAINRFQKIISEYDQTIFVEEAIHRLVEINYTLGLLEESKKYAKLLGYNYQSSEWYERSYNIVNTNYKKTNIKKNLKKEKSLLKKFKDLFK